MDTLGNIKKEQKIDKQLKMNSIQESQQENIFNQQMQPQQEIRQENQSMLPAYERVQVSDRVQRVREAVNGRTISAILTSEITNSDSKEMTAVKEKISVCNAVLDKKLSAANDMESFHEQIKVLETAYLDAISACQYYCDHKDPVFESGKLRKKAVADTLELLKKELQLFPQMQSEINEEKLAQYGDQVKFIDLIAEEGIRQEEAKEAGKKQKQEEPIEALRYEDFAKLLSADASDYLEFRGQNLRVVKSGIFSSPSKVTTESNKKMVERFITLAIQKLEQRQELSDTQKTNMKIRLQYQLDVKLLDTQAGAVSVSKMRDAMEMIDHLSSDVDNVLQQDKNATAMEHRLAMAVNEKLEIPTTDAVNSKAIHKQLQNILEEARKSGMKLPDVNDSDLENIVAGRLYSIRDEVFHNLQNICQSMGHLNGGSAPDFNALASDQKVINNMYALIISRMAATSPAWAEAADYQLREYMAHAAFVHSRHASLEQDFKKTRIDALSINGRSGLYGQVISQISKTKKWKGNIGSVEDGMHNLGEVCALLHKLSVMKSQAFSNGLSQEEAAEMTEAALKLQNIVNQKDVVSNMKLVADNMKGTRFYDGFGRLQELIKEPEVFKNSTDRIVRTLTIRNQDQKESVLALEREKFKKDLGIDDETANISLDETQKILSEFEGDMKDIVSMMLMQKKPSELIKKSGDENAKDIVRLFYGLQSLKAGDAWADITIKDKKVTLVPRENGDVELRIDKKKIPMPFQAEFLMHRLEMDVSENMEKYGDKLTEDVFRNAFAQTKQDIFNQEEGTAGSHRLAFINVLNQKTGLDASFFRNTPVETLAQMAEYALKGIMDRTDVEELVRYEEENSTVMLNEKDTLEAIRMMEQNEKSQKYAKKTVTIQEQKEEEDNASQWESDEAELIELISDMIFSKDTWKLDMEKRESADRIRMLMYEHAGLLGKLIKKPDLIKQTFGKLQIPGAEGMADMVKGTFDNFLKSDGMSKLKVLSEKNLVLMLKAVLGDEQDMENAKPAIETIVNAASMMRKAGSFFSFNKADKSNEEEEKEKDRKNIIDTILEQKEGMLQTFKEVDDELNQQTSAQVEQIQEEISKAVNTVFDSKEEDDVNIEDLSLTKMMERNVKGQEGQGKFYKLILTQYFKNANTMDQRAMLASAFRDAKPKQLKEGEQLTDKEKEEQTGAFLGGFFKGAGPLLHKILQGLPTDGMPDSLKIAIGDMKSKLTPIAPQIVKARMDKMVQNSKGMITNIDVQRSLGAASVGQVFLCKIYGPNLPKEGKDVVIKLLRPDVQNHMEREKEFILQCARDTSEGMLKTFEGQLQSIEREMDLRIEAQNVELGKVYDKGSKTVKSMKAINLVSPDVNALMLEKAPGTTVDKYQKAVEKEFEELKKEYKATQNRDGGYSVKKRMKKLIDDMSKRHEHVAELAKKWLITGIYKEGFYHGDLHAGNIMVDENQATVLDFGNATQITKDQQNSILHMVCAAESQNIDGFSDHFYNLLSPESKASFKQKEKDFREMLGNVLFKDGDVGERIAVALAEAQKIGLELPAAIHNFSQCQIRLKNTVDDMVSQIKGMQNELKKMDTIHSDTKDVADPFAYIGKSVQYNMNERAKYNRKETQNRPKPLEAVVLSKLHEADAFEKSKFKQQMKGIPSNMGIITTMHRYLAELQNLSSGASMIESLEEEGRKIYVAGLKKKAAEICDKVANDFQVDTPEFKEFKEKLTGWFDRPGAELQELKDYTAEFIRIPKSEVLDDYLIMLDNARKLKNDKSADKEARKKAEDELIAEAKKLYEKEAASPYGKLQNEMLSLDKNMQRSFELKITPWFNDKDNYGDELQQTYNRIQEMKQNGQQPDENSEPVRAFRELFERAAIQRAHWLENQQNEKQSDPAVFFKVMQDVVKDKLTSTIWSLGAKGIWRYQMKSNKKPELSGQAALRQQQKQEAANIMRALDGDIRDAFINIAVRIMRMQDAQEEQKETIKNDIIADINSRLLNALAQAPFSSDDGGYFGNELQHFIANRDMMHLYNFTKRIQEIWKAKLKLLPDSEYVADDWDETVEILHDIVFQGQQNPQANGQEAGDNK